MERERWGLRGESTGLCLQALTSLGMDTYLQSSQRHLNFTKAMNLSLSGQITYNFGGGGEKWQQYQFFSGLRFQSLGWQMKSHWNHKGRSDFKGTKVLHAEVLLLKEVGNMELSSLLCAESQFWRYLSSVKDQGEDADYIHQITEIEQQRSVVRKETSQKQHTEMTVFSQVLLHVRTSSD